MDPINGLASFELTKTNESDNSQSLARERERNIEKDSEMVGQPSIDFSL